MYENANRFEHCKTSVKIQIIHFSVVRFKFRTGLNDRLFDIVLARSYI